MKKYALLISFVIVIGLIGCGGGDSSTPYIPPAKNLFSLWKNVETNAPLDIRSGALSTPMPMFFLFQDGTQCQCELILIGDQSSGAWSLSQCGYVSGTGTGDPGCVSLNASGTYKKDYFNLSICGGNSPGCDKYK